MGTKKTAVVLTGRPGCGKGTQAKLILASSGIYTYIGTGETLRRLAEESTELGRFIKEQLRGGGLVDDELVDQGVIASLERLPDEAVPVLDGYPRNLSQALVFLMAAKGLGFDNIITIHLEVPKECCPNRLEKRVAENAGIGQSREDDNAGTFAMRLRTYETETMPVVNLLSLNTHFVEIDGSQGISEVAAQIALVLERRLQKTAMVW